MDTEYFKINFNDCGIIIYGLFRRMAVRCPLGFGSSFYAMSWCFRLTHH